MALTTRTKIARFVNTLVGLAEIDNLLKVQTAETRQNLYHCQ